MTVITGPLGFYPQDKILASSSIVPALELPALRPGCYGVSENVRKHYKEAVRILSVTQANVFVDTAVY